MSKWAHEMALKTYQDIQNKRERKAEGIKQADSYCYEIRATSLGIRNHRKNGNRVVVKQV